ncbi:MAG: hypothetical protein M1834_008272 [Cirrosporium novae-zelandiae]|nr:MAG: hypothetical protein M1834_008272 [Cirrosporium novae-zelandiae]
MASKIIVIGSLNGHFKEAFLKLARLQAKNAFSVAIATGNFFGDHDEESLDQDLKALLAGEMSIPLPMYFTMGDRQLPKAVIERLETNSEELCENLFFLPRTLKTSEGLRIVALGGQLNDSSEKDEGQTRNKYGSFYKENDVKSLRGVNTADLLITYQWPASIRSGSKVDIPSPAKAPEDIQGIADLCAAIKPRYHFAASDDIFFEREPFFLPDTDNLDVKHITRFISMAAYGNTQKQKWIYAFSLDPKAPPPTELPTGTTASPFLGSQKKRQRLPDQEQSFSRFSSSSDHHQGDNYRSNKRSRQRAPPTPAECFFCLSNPNLATHLITSIGNDAYLTISKGPLSTSETFPNLGFPSHILIIPLTHSPTIASISEVTVRESTFKEMTQYREALQSMVQEKSSGKLGAVTFEINRSRGVHILWQFLPIPVDLVKRGLVEAAFKVEGENEKYPKFEKRDIGDGSNENGDYFRVWIWGPPVETAEESGTMEVEGPAKENSGVETSLIMPFSSALRFDLQFGRRVLAKLLGLEKRIFWQDCGQAQAEEEADAEAFKKAFKDFDFSLSE